MQVKTKGLYVRDTTPGTLWKVLDAADFISGTVCMTLDNGCFVILETGEVFEAQNTAPIQLIDGYFQET